MKHETNLSLSTPGWLGRHELPHRIVMAPLTRSRAGAGNAPTLMNVQYYAQRASAALVITEATQISTGGVGYPDTPGIHTPDQIDGWRRVVEAVHRCGGRIYLQLWHVGRVSHPSYHQGALPVAPSAIAPSGETSTPNGPAPFVIPRSLLLEDIHGVIDDFRSAARNAQEAGFDGVEIHAGNGYLIDQFLRDGTNRRTDRYGGSVHNRIRFLVEIVEAVTAVWGADRVGVRISPLSSFNDMQDSNPQDTFTHAVAQLNTFPGVYLHIVGQDDFLGTPQTFDLGVLRSRFEGPVVANHGYDFVSGTDAIRSGAADFVSYGRLFLANPDLPERFLRGAPLNEPDYATFYGGDERGYTDYPFLNDAAGCEAA